MTKIDRTAIIVALIGTAGVLGAAAIGAWNRNRSEPAVTPSVRDTTPPSSDTPTGMHAASPEQHCVKPTSPVLTQPGANQVQSNHYYGRGEPLRFSWLASSCVGGSVRGYRIVVMAVGASVPAIDEFVSEPQYVGDTSGTISAYEWTWRVQAIDDLNQLSDWSEERKFLVGQWREP